jgi:hypothetical protein
MLQLLPMLPLLPLLPLGVAALVQEVVVSRIGHFTCPVQSGALFLGQLPAGMTTAAAAAADTDAAAAGATDPLALKQVLLLKHDPYSAAMHGASDAAAVLAAVAAGLLPAVLRHQQESGAEWIEFAPLTRQQRQQRASQGWHLRPVLWFR